jgi:hypothetical protein
MAVHKAVPMTVHKAEKRLYTSLYTRQYTKLDT